MVLALGVGVDVSLREPGWLELLFRVKRSLVEPVGRTRLARLAGVNNRFLFGRHRHRTAPKEGTASESIAALLARLGKRIEIEDDAQGPRCAGDGQTRLII